MALCGVVVLHTAAHAESVALVRTEPIRRVALSERLVAYGTVTPDAGSLTNISVPRPARVVNVRVSAGQPVRAGQVLLQVATDSSATLTYQQAQNAGDLARNELRRVEQLLAQRLATQSQRDAARKTLRDAEDALRAQQKIGGNIGVETIVSPFQGTVVTLSVAPGDRIAQGQAMIQMSRERIVRIPLGVEPEDSLRVRVGMPVRLEPVFGAAKPFDTKVSEVQQTINPQTQLVDIVVRPSGAGVSSFLPGMRLRGLITVATEEGWAVPRSAVLRDQAGAYIFQVKSGKAARVDVKTGLASDGQVHVSGAFDTAAPVVVIGNYELQDAMPVREDKK